MPYWLFDLLVLVLPAALLLRGMHPPARLVAAVAVLSVVALVWTAPWDEHLVRTGVWAYGPDRVLATLGSVPVEEYAFVVLLVVLVAAWGVRTGRLPGRPRDGAALAGHRATGALGWLCVGGAGVGLIAAGGTWRYLGLLLVWIAPPMLLQRAVAGDVLRARRSDRAVVVLPVTLWLCVADRLALADGVWTIDPASSTGLHVLGLPLEEGLFFLLVVVLVTDGLLLATDRTALSRARALLRRWPAGARATTRPSPPRSAPAASGPVRTWP